MSKPTTPPHDQPLRESEPAQAATPPIAAATQVRPASAADLKLDRVIAVVHRYGPAFTVLALMLVVAWAYSHVFAGEPNGDDNTFHLGETRRIADCLMQGDYDFWNWSANGGYASGYYYQLLPLFTPAALTAASGGHLLFWFQLCMFLPLVLAPLATYRGARALGATPWESAMAAIAVAFAISNSRWGHGADGNFSVGLYTQTWAFAAFPLALGRGAQWLATGKKLAAAVAWGTFVGLCHPFAGVALGLAFVMGVVLPLMLSPLIRLASPSFLTEPNASADRPGEGWRQFGRLCILGILLLVASTPGWITVLVDYAGFGGFPHRVADEVGPGFKGLMKWQWAGHILDHGRRLHVLGWCLPVVLLMARSKYLRWCWPPALGYAALLSVGPHLVTPDDLFPAVRFLGALQIVLAMAAGIGMVQVGKLLWRWSERAPEPLIPRTAVAAVAAVLITLVVLPGARMQHSRVLVATDYPSNRRDEMQMIMERFKDLPPGRKQAMGGAENHWWNLLPYVYAERSALLQMGGGGLQASPNYDFIWSTPDVRKKAHLYFAPYLLFARSKAESIPAGRTIMVTEAFELRKIDDDGLVSAAAVTGRIAGPRKAAKKAALAWLASDAPMKNQVLAYEPAAEDLPATVNGKVEWSVQMPSAGDDPDVSAQVTVTQPTLFVARTSWHPRWHVEIDGVRAPIVRVTPDFPAVLVGPGEHRLHFRFARPSWANTTWLLWPCCTLLGFGIEAWLSLRRRRNLPQVIVQVA